MMPARKKGSVSSAGADTKKSAAEEAAENVKDQLVHKRWVERTSPVVRFFLAIFGSLALSSTLFTLMPGAALGELGRVSKHLEAWWEVGGLMAWKAVEVGLAWILGFDGRDTSSFVFLIHLPTYALLSSFYNLRPTTILTSYAIVLFSTTFPFILLRKPTSVHNLARAPSSAVSNRSILQDSVITLYTITVAAAIYTVVLYFSYETWLPAQLVVHIERLPNIEKVHAGPAGLPILFLTLLPAGWAARDFLFVSSTGTPEEDAETKKKAAAPREGEYLACTVYRKTWGALAARTRVLVSRTVVLAAMLMANTIVQIAGTVNGASIHAATAWGVAWAFATLVVGVTYGWIEGVDGL